MLSIFFKNIVHRGLFSHCNEAKGNFTSKKLINITEVVIYIENKFSLKSILSLIEQIVMDSVHAFMECSHVLAGLHHPSPLNSETN